MARPELAEFQRATVDRICKRLGDPNGSHRFLLADEVGLGKTIVARGVIERLLERRRTPLIVVYLCSNAEIAEQNRRKLDPRAGRPLRRLSEIALRSGEKAGELQLFSFTPGTSLHDGTGLAWERRLLLFLMGRVQDRDVNQRRWREFFRCGVHEDRWYPDTRPGELEDEFRRKITVEFQQKLGEDWRRPIELDGERIVLSRSLDEEVDRFAAGADSVEVRRRRNRLVAVLRKGLQRVALDYLEPDLVILDEVQRFKEVLDEEQDSHSVAGRLFRKKDAAVLILSATPYKMLTLSHEGEDHYADLLRTLGFLFRGDREGGVEPIKRDLELFQSRLKGAHFLAGPDPELRTIKSRLEHTLRRVVCRTERNWYIEDLRKGVAELRAGQQEARLPQTEELLEFVRLRRFLLDKEDTSFRITEYWKSCPSPLTFMDGSYAAMRGLRRGGARLPGGLVADAEVLGRLYRRNHRFRALFAMLFGEKPDSWRYLWTRPTYTYYRDEFFGDASPDKLLVFSSWRFVPKAIALLVSEEAESRLHPFAPDEDSAPLRFTDRRSFQVFDVCFPSVALASALSPVTLMTQGDLTAADVLAYAERVLRARLEACGVRVGETGNDPIWQVVARLEAGSGFAGTVTEALKARRLAGADQEASQYYETHRDLFLEWLRDVKTPLSMSETRVRRLAKIAAFSPAVSLLRALWSMYPETRRTLPLALVDVCIGPLRGYFNRPVVQAVVNGNSRERHYTDRVLSYCRDAHIQAVFDEYVFLLCDVAQRSTPGEAVEHVGRVLGIGVGMPKVNVVRPAGEGYWRIADDAKQRRAHLALAFGEDVSEGEGSPGEVSGAVRKTQIREAFNSPFWPFVRATTSVGQEGIDLHLYCRDIVHWNLPSNPVDLEQREGRINRRDGLAIRRSIGMDLRLRDAVPSANGGEGNPWQWIFAALGASPGLQRYKHGLYPHWIYESDNGRGGGIRRHLLFYEHSADAARYERLKKGLALYRLVFGQPRQEDLLEDLERRIRDAGIDVAAADVRRRLPGYMINLSPFDRGYAWERAEMEAEEINDDGDAVRGLVADVERTLAIRGDDLRAVEGELRELIGVALMDGPPAAVARRGRRYALAALAYLRNPYDTEFDSHLEVGLEDDAAVVRSAFKAVCAGQSPRER